MVHWDELRRELGEAATLASVAHLLGWDQETYMPAGGADARAEQLALVGRLAHERATHPRVGELLAACEQDATLVARPGVAEDLREIRRDFERGRRLPADLVAEAAATGSRALEAWRTARRSSDFAAFAPWLERQLDIARRKAACWGTPAGGEPYDALLDEYEPGMRAAALDALFAPLREELTPLIAAIAASRRRPAIVEPVLSTDLQHALCRQVIEALGFDPAAGRLDVSTHPFACGVAAGDTRITTRFESGLFDALGSTMHEAGHALYEQGLPKRAAAGLPGGEALGLGIHESQSRLWENHVGRSRPFWSWVGPLARDQFGAALATLDDESLWANANAVRPNLIRVESDEATYNLHVMLRFDLERALLRGDLPVADLPAAWNERIRNDLGLEVPDDARGCLQDVHWAMGSIGYFPTYTLGTLYAAQFFEAAERDLPGLADGFATGRFAPLLEWLRDRIHRHGRRIPADRLCLDVTGRELDHLALLRHLRGTLSRLYDLG